MLLVSLVMQVLSVGNTMVNATTTDTVQQVQDQMVAGGIRYQEKKYSNYNGVADKKERAFIITADMNDPTVNIISSKAKDKVLKLETVSDQISREQFKGNNVVAGINEDMFNISAGTPTYGTPVGLQVKDGSASHITATDKARTAIGIKADNKVVALVVDGGGAAKESYGMTLPDMGTMMREQGVVAAISLDGGGSTQMNSRFYGQQQVGVVDIPSDGSERVVTNSILFTTAAPKTYDVNKLQVDKDIVIYKNDTFPFKVKGTDQGGNPVDLNNADIQ
jgi:exopolysaccharide biosynthesis protein